MCAGQFSVIENEDEQTPVPMKIFLRDSKLSCIDAKEHFRVVTEGIKFYESFTGVKFPWDKYD
jgi:aminopeptidase N